MGFVQSSRRDWKLFENQASTPISLVRSPLPHSQAVHLVGLQQALTIHWWTSYSHFPGIQSHSLPRIMELPLTRPTVWSELPIQSTSLFLQNSFPSYAKIFILGPSMDFSNPWFSTLKLQRRAWDTESKIYIYFFFYLITTRMINFLLQWY